MKNKSSQIATKAQCSLIGPLHVCLPSPSESSQLHNKPLKGRFDSDSYTIGIDNHASACMVNDSHFIVGELEPLPSRKVKGAKGLLEVKGRGLGRFPIEDDDGVHHELLIPQTLLVPELPICLIGPQHWSQLEKDNFPKWHGRWCTTYSNECVLYWN